MPQYLQENLCVLTTLTASSLAFASTQIHIELAGSAHRYHKSPLNAKRQESCGYHFLKSFGMTNKGIEP